MGIASYDVLCLSLMSHRFWYGKLYMLPSKLTSMAWYSNAELLNGAYIQTLTMPGLNISDSSAFYILITWGVIYSEIPRMNPISYHWVKICDEPILQSIRKYTGPFIGLTTFHVKIPSSNDKLNQFNRDRMIKSSFLRYRQGKRSKVGGFK